VLVPRRLSKFDDVDAVLLGISPQDVDSHERWATKRDFHFPLLADTDKKVIELYGVRGGKLIPVKRVGVRRRPDGMVRFVDRKGSARRSCRPTSWRRCWRRLIPWTSPRRSSSCGPTTAGDGDDPQPDGHVAMSPIACDVDDDGQGGGQHPRDRDEGEAHRAGAARRDLRAQRRLLRRVGAGRGRRPRSCTCRRRWTV
jgi:hypothetical protein